MVDVTEAPFHDDVIKWKHVPRYWPFVRGIHRSPVNSLHKGQWRTALMFFYLCLNKRLNIQSWGWWFETQLCPLWRHCNALICRWGTFMLFRARHLFFPQLGRRTTIKQHGLVRNRNLLGHNDNILYFVFVMKKKKKSVKTLIICTFTFFQDCCLWSTLTHHKSFVFLSRGSVVYPCPFWRQREQDYISKDKKMYGN